MHDEFHPVEQVTTRTLSRGLAVLKAILDADSAPTLTELSETTGLPKATISRLLATLVDAGFAAQLPGTQRYSAGVALAARMRASSLESLLVERATRIVASLRDSSGETTVLCTPVWPDRVCVVASQSHHQVRAQKALGEVGPLTRGCTGRAFLAFAGDERIERALALRPIMQGTPKTVTQHDDFRRLLQVEREQGYSLSFESTFPDMTGVAVPVFGADTAMPIATISVSGPSSRWTVAAMTDFVPQLRSAAQELSESFTARVA
jgi:DNA-binding IclR family transcriptional regulator